MIYLLQISATFCCTTTEYLDEVGSSFSLCVTSTHVLFVLMVQTVTYQTALALWTSSWTTAESAVARAYSEFDITLYYSRLVNIIDAEGYLILCSVN